MISKTIVVDYALKFQIALFDAQLLFARLEHFLEHSASTDEINVPDWDVDQAWHHFILHTKEYQNYCEEHFNKFIHHNPRTPSYEIENGEIKVKEAILVSANFSRGRCDDEE